MGSYFSRDGGAPEYFIMRVGEGLKTFDALKMMFNVRNVSLGVKWELHERVVVPKKSHLFRST